MVKMCGKSETLSLFIINGIILNNIDKSVVEMNTITGILTHPKLRTDSQTKILENSQLDTHNYWHQNMFWDYIYNCHIWKSMFVNRDVLNIPTIHLICSLKRKRKDPHLGPTRATENAII